MKKKTFIICVEINTPSDAQRVKSNISTHIAEKYVEVMDNVYIVIARNPNATCEMLRGMLAAFLPDFQLLIMQTSQNAAWRLTPETDSKLLDII